MLIIKQTSLRIKAIGVPQRPVPIMLSHPSEAISDTLVRYGSFPVSLSILKSIKEWF